LRPTEIRRIKCNSPADCCRRGLDRAEPLSSPVAKMQTNLWRVMPPCGKNANESTVGHAALRQNITAGASPRPTPVNELPHVWGPASRTVHKSTPNRPSRTPVPTGSQ